MWFKNLQLFYFSKPFTLKAEELDEKLSSYTLGSCGAMELSSIGWIPPLGKETEVLAHAANGFIMICLGIQEKLMPPAVIRDELQEKIDQIEGEEDRKVRGSEKVQLKDQIIHEMLPRAFVKKQRVYAYIDPKNNWLVIDAASRKMAEEFAEFLRVTLGSLPVVPPDVKLAPSSVFTKWLASGSADSFAVDAECELQHQDIESGTAKFKNMNLSSSEVMAHISAGSVVTKIAVTWNEKISCFLTQELEVKRLKFDDAVKEEAAEQSGETDAARFDADFAIMTYELSKFINALIKQFDGLEDL
ncbi:MAG: recombination-associated protein RdgC [Gammaproteobacteria bacterium]|mgnify:FL=1|nr:MAG: recombination-associated protein RdgC [Gammaproteobacteria bacterium]